jgi:hypothetical protein
MLVIGPAVGSAALLWLGSAASHRLTGSVMLAVLAAPLWVLFLSLPIMGVGSTVFVLHAERQMRRGAWTNLSSVLVLNRKERPGGTVCFELHLENGLRLLRAFADHDSAHGRLHALRCDLEAGMAMLVECHCAPLLARGHVVEIEATPILAGALPRRLERLGFQRSALRGRARATMTLTWIAGLPELILMRAFTFGTLHWVGLPPLALYRTTGAALVERWGGGTTQTRAVVNG